MRFLVVANVLSEATKPAPNARVLNWLRTHERDLAINPVVLGELRFGILLLARSRKREASERWFDAGAARLVCLPWDAETGVKWADLLAHLRRVGKAMPIKESLIAATALVHGLTVATRNRADFSNVAYESSILSLNESTLPGFQAHQDMQCANCSLSPCNGAFG